MNPRPVRVRSVGTATADHEVAQSQAREFAHGFFADDFPALDRLLRAFDNTGIAARQLASPLAWYREPHAFTDKNAVYRRVAGQMALEASRRAVSGEQTGMAIDRKAIRAVVMVSTTGISTPSLDSDLIQQLDLSRQVHRVPVWGLGCAGGAAGLARAADLARGLDGPVLLVATEVCSATFMHGDRSKANLIATALFGDGAAAVVLEPTPSDATGPQFELFGGHSQLIDDSEDVMGWTLHEQGLQVRFAKSIPGIVHELVPGFVRDAAEQAGLPEEAIHHFVVHPGGAKVLEAYRETLSLPSERLAQAWSVLRRHGNMSSVTVLFVLDAVLREVPPSERYGLVIGLGPGFCAEGVVCRW